MFRTATKASAKQFRWLAVVLLSALASLLSVTSSCSSACGNNLVREVPEPGGSFKLAIFERDCGATTGFVTHIALLRKNDSLSNATVGDIFVADSNHGAASPMDVDGHWNSKSGIVITYPSSARVYKRSDHVDDFAVSYLTK